MMIEPKFGPLQKFAINENRLGPCSESALLQLSADELNALVLTLWHQSKLVFSFLSDEAIISLLEAWMKLANPYTLSILCYLVQGLLPGHDHREYCRRYIKRAGLAIPREHKAAMKNYQDAVEIDRMEW